MLKSQESEMHLSPASQEQTTNRKQANPGMAVEEHMRHLNCLSASEPELEEPGRGTKSGICGPEDITSTKQCITGTNHHLASVWMTKKKGIMSLQTHTRHTTFGYWPQSMWLVQLKTSKQTKTPARNRREATLCKAGEAGVAHLSIV